MFLFSRFFIGHNYLEYTATDYAGNEASCSQHIEVKGLYMTLQKYIVLSF